MKLSTIIRLFVTGISSIVFSATIGYWFIKLDYPENKYHERLAAIYAEDVLPVSLLGMTIGLLISERIIKRLEIEKSTHQQVKTLAQKRLAASNLTPSEFEAWTTILSQQKED